MHVETERSGNILVARIYGEIDHHTSGELRRRLDMEMISMGINVLILDMSGVGFMDSSGIGMMLGRQKNMELLGGKTFVTGMKKNVRRLIEITGFKGVFIFYDDLSDALRDAIDGQDRNISVGGGSI